MMRNLEQLQIRAAVALEKATFTVEVAQDVQTTRLLLDAWEHDPRATKVSDITVWDQTRFHGYTFPTYGNEKLPPSTTELTIALSDNLEYPEVLVMTTNENPQNRQIYRIDTKDMSVEWANGDQGPKSLYYAERLSQALLEQLTSILTHI